MMKKILLSAASVTVLAACSWQAAEPEIYTEGDETTTAAYRSYPMAEGSEVVMEDKHYHDNMGWHTHEYTDKMHAHAHVNTVESDKEDVNVMYDASRVHFDFDSASLSMEAREKLSTLADRIREEGASEITVEGHCDERGTREYNLALGERRAVAVKKYLVGLGVSSSKISTISYGKERPVNPAHNEEAWTENRRGVVNFK